MKFLISILILCASPIAFGQKEMKRDDFIAIFEEKFPEIFCQPDQFARVCFTYDYEQCVNLTKTHLSACLSTNTADMPQLFTSRDDASSWGRKIGQCAGSEFGRKQIKDSDVTAQCVGVIGVAMAHKLFGS